MSTITTLLTNEKNVAHLETKVLTNSAQSFMTSHKNLKNNTTEINKPINAEILNVSTNILTPKKRRLVPNAALNLLRRKRDLQIHNFFNRHNSSQKNLINSNSSVNNFSVLFPKVENQCLIEESTPLDTTCGASTLSSTTLADERSDVFHASTMASTHKANVRVQRRDVSGDFHQSSTSTPTHGQISSSTSVTTNIGNSGNYYHLNVLPGSSGLHARRESFLYRNSDEREPLFNIAPLLCRPVSRASSVVSSDQQYVKLFLHIFYNLIKFFF